MSGLTKGGDRNRRHPAEHDGTGIVARRYFDYRSPRRVCDGVAGVPADGKHTVPHGQATVGPGRRWSNGDDVPNGSVPWPVRVRVPAPRHPDTRVEPGKVGHLGPRADDGHLELNHHFAGRQGRLIDMYLFDLAVALSDEYQARAIQHVGLLASKRGGLPSHHRAGRSAEGRVKPPLARPSFRCESNCRRRRKATHGEPRPTTSRDIRASRPSSSGHRARRAFGPLVLRLSVPTCRGFASAVGITSWPARPRSAGTTRSTWRIEIPGSTAG